MKEDLEKVRGIYRSKNILSHMIGGKEKKVNKDIGRLIDLKWRGEEIYIVIPLFSEEKWKPIHWLKVCVISSVLVYVSGVNVSEVDRDLMT